MKIIKKILLSYQLISKVNKKKYLFLTILQITLPILDIIGIFMIGLLLQSLLAVDSVNSKKSNLMFESEIVQFLNLNHQQYLLLLASTSAVLFMSKGFFSVIVNSICYKTLSKASLNFSSQVARNFFKGDLSTVQYLPSARVGAALNDSINNKIVSILGAFGSLIGELTLIASICIFLFFYNGIVTTISIIYFLSVFVFLQRYLAKSTSTLARVRANSDENIRSLMSESIDSYRELFVLDAMDKMLEEYNEERKRAANSQATLYWLVNLPKYVYESVLIVGVVILVGLNLLLPNGDIFQMTVATFLIAGVRVLPSILRIQNLLNIIEYSSASSVYLEEVMGLKSKKGVFEDNADHNLVSLKTHQSQYLPSVEVNGLIFSYFGNVRFELRIDKLDIEPGEKIALVGESGSGKSTFVDLLLGVLEPDDGEIKISSLPSAESIQVFQGKVGYVPQSANLFSTDIFGNIALYELKTKENVERAWECLKMAQLASFVRQLPEGIHTEIGERGYKLSGGQKQRLSLARALFPKPRLLVLDEATSALDAEIENDIRLAVESLDLRTTVIVIAHRLSTVKSFDRLLYFENGKIIGDGTFDELRKKIKKFDIQASLSGY
jgi:ATP-binding cassette subfamily C protein